MATKLKPRAAGLYEADFPAWSKEQADLLRARRFEDLDLTNLIEEVADLGESLKRAARSRVRTIIEHLLKLQYSPATETRPGWRDTVRVQRDDLADSLTPTVRQDLRDHLSELYERARRRAADSLRDHGEQKAADAMPAGCPYALEQILGDWLP
jgi:hypothetical protein